ncbi:MAG: glycosyltransferase family 2 protein [Saprospiraceae bacterium]|nr:glycosyltransferase family 2 protein [Saprospiraceae bacterium]
MIRPKLSVVVCVFNEEENIDPLIHQIDAALQQMEYEIIYVDDGSTDGTLKKLQSNRHPRLRTVEFRRNYGQSSALAAGIDEAKGEFIATLDGDLQNDPSDIPMMLRLAEEENWDVVAGIRANRKDGMFLRLIPSKIANMIIQRSSGIKMKDYGCTLKVFRSEIAKDMGLYGELHRFIPVLASLEGARITQVDVKHHARQFGESKYGINRTFKVMSDLILMLFMKKYLPKPMHLFGTVGLLAFFIGLLINIYLLFLKFLGQDIWGKPLLFAGALFIIFGIQLVTIGLVVEIQMRTYYESQNKKPYKIRKIHQGASKHTIIR